MGNLIDLIRDNKPNEEIETYLKELEREKKLYPQLLAKDSNGNDALHIAINQENEELVKILLGFGSPINGAEEFARKKGKPRIAAIIRTRNYWRIQAAKIACVNFERTIRLIESNFNIKESDVIKAKNGVFIFGRTAHGKSTLVNYLRGIDHDIHGTRSKPIVTTKKGAVNSPLAKTGKGIVSETYIPQGFSFKEGNALIDMPGVGDTRGEQIEIGAAVCSQHLTKQLAGIKCIVFICDIRSFTESIPVHYFEIAELIGRIIDNDRTINVLFVLTKNEMENFPHEEILGKLKDIQLKYTEIVSSKDEKQEQKYDPRLVLLTTSAISANIDKNLHVADIRSPNSRDWLSRAILNCKPGSVDKFVGPYKALDRFMVFMEVIAEYYYLTKANIKNNKGIYVGLHRLIGEVGRVSKADAITNFIFNVVAIIPTITENHIHSYFLEIPKNSADKIKLFFIKQQRDKLLLEQITINDEKKFIDALQKLGGNFAAGKDLRLTLTKDQVNELVTKNSNPKHTPINNYQSLMTYVDKLTRLKKYKTPNWLWAIRCISILIFALLAFLEIAKRTPRGATMKGSTATSLKMGFFVGASWAGSESLVWLHKKVSEFGSSKLEKIVEGMKGNIIQLGANEARIRKYINDSIELLGQSSSILRAEFEQSKLELEANYDSYHKVAKVLSSLDLSQHKKLEDFVSDIATLDKFLENIDDEIQNKASHADDIKPQLVSKL